MSRICLPTTGSHDWQWLLASPGLHWKHGASAMALADAWENANTWPDPVASALATDRDLSDLELLLALPEHQVPLPGGSRASQTDLFVLARNADGELVTIAVEGKAEEPFGDDTVSGWRAADGPGRRQRLAYLLDVLGLPDDERLASIRYQLLHRTASAIIEARRFGARHAVMMVQSFSPAHAWFADFVAFAQLYAATASRGATVRAAQLGDVRLHLASGLPGLRSLSDLARRRQLDGYVDRILDRDIPDDAGVVIRSPAALRRWMAAYAAASSTTATFETVRDAASAGHQHKPSKNATQAYRDALTRVWVLDEVPAWIRLRAGGDDDSVKHTVTELLLEPCPDHDLD